MIYLSTDAEKRQRKIVSQRFAFPLVSAGFVSCEQVIIVPMLAFYPLRIALLVCMAATAQFVAVLSGPFVELVVDMQDIATESVVIDAISHFRR